MLAKRSNHAGSALKRRQLIIMQLACAEFSAGLATKGFRALVGVSLATDRSSPELLGLPNVKRVLKFMPRHTCRILCSIANLVKYLHCLAATT